MWNGSLINQFQYSYDSLGNITSVCDAHTGKRVSYTYDDQGQLLTATHTDNDTVTRTEVYTYDNVGNILTFNNGTTSHSYTYGDSDWKDLLTAVDGNAITYDASGNPTSYYNGYTMTWVEGRKLDTVTVNGQTYTYVYNSDGQRVKKINPDGSYIEYYVMDGTTVGESHFTATGNKTLGIRYTLDENTNVIGFTMNGVNYYFAKNLQGDVLAVYNATTNEIAAQYTYDSWGNVLSATGTLEEINPFRYRSYYYDEETDFYYLQSRYYDAAIGRFINADSYASTGQGILGNDMFTYCLNNPVTYIDPSGNLTRGEIHNLVLQRIVLDKAFEGRNTLRWHKTCIYYNGIDASESWGFCDLYDSSTFEVWELKRITCSKSKAQKQLANYVGGGLKAHLGKTLRTGGRLFPEGTIKHFTHCDASGTYEIEYWDDGDGILWYDYTFRKSWRKKAQEAIAAIGGTVAVAAMCVAITYFGGTTAAGVGTVIPFIQQTAENFSNVA